MAFCAGIDMPDFENQLDMVYSPAGVNLAVASRIIWGNSEIGANLTLVADPMPEFGLALFVNIPASEYCTFDFVVEATAAMVLDDSSGIGIGGEFTFGATGFDPEVVGCMAAEMQEEVRNFWTNMLGEWVGDATSFLSGAHTALVGAYYGNNMGLCSCTRSYCPGMRTCDPDTCGPMDDDPCAGACWCDEETFPDTCRCACPDDPADCINPTGDDAGEEKRLACSARCATQDGRDLSLRGQYPDGNGRRRRRVQQEEGGGVWGEYVTLNGNRTFVPELVLPSVEELEDADCVEWAPPKAQNAAPVCVRHAHKHYSLHAGLIRLRLLLADPIVRLLLKDGGRGLDLGGGRRGSDILAEAAARQQDDGGDDDALDEKSSAAAMQRRRRRKGFGSWAGQQLQHLTEAAAEAIEVRKTASVFEFSLCLSRACLGKMIVFIYKWRKNAVFRRGSGHSSINWTEILTSLVRSIYTLTPLLLRGMSVGVFPFSRGVFFFFSYARKSLTGLVGAVSPGYPARRCQLVRLQRINSA
eukprot:COSAG06_NODE_72_length_25897_cov_9.227382_9_plen_527_part_00